MKFSEALKKYLDLREDPIPMDAGWTPYYQWLALCKARDNEMNSLLAEMDRAIEEVRASENLVDKS